jgi:hypothetical protein
MAGAAHRGDAKRFLHALALIDENPQCWRAGMKAMGKQPCSERFRRFFLRVYLQFGDHIRQEVEFWPRAAVRLELSSSLRRWKTFA